MKNNLQAILAFIFVGGAIGCGIYGYISHSVVGNDGGALGFGVISATALAMFVQLEISKGKKD